MLDVPSPLASEVSFVYPVELRIARTGVTMINRRVEGANLPEDEAYAIALHIVNGELGAAGDESTIHLVMESAKVISVATDIIERDTGASIDRESYAFHRFTAHFRYLVARLMKGDEHAESTKNNTLFKQAAQDFPEVYGCVRKIASYLESTYQWSCSNEELLYLMMHINRLITS